MRVREKGSRRTGLAKAERATSITLRAAALQEVWKALAFLIDSTREYVSVTESSSGERADLEASIRRACEGHPTRRALRGWMSSTFQGYLAVSDIICRAVWRIRVARSAIVNSERLLLH